MGNSDNTNNLLVTQANNILDLIGSVSFATQSNKVTNIAPATFPQGDSLIRSDVIFYKINQLSYDEEFPQREALQNVLETISSPEVNIVYILSGSGKGVELYLGVVKNENYGKNKSTPRMSVGDYGTILEDAFTANFPGSELEKLDWETNLQEVISNSVKNFPCAGIVTGVPSVNEKEGKEEYDFQGMDRLINSMMGRCWRLVVVAEPVCSEEVLEVREDIYELYNRLSVCAKRSLQEGVNDGKSISFGTSTSESRGKTKGINGGDSTSSGENYGYEKKYNKGTSHTKGWSSGTSESYTRGKNQGYTWNKGSSHSVTIELANKKAQELMQYIDEELLQRLKTGYSRGMFKTSVYYMANCPADASRLASSIISLFQGNNSSYSPLVAQEMELKGNLKILRTYQNRYINLPDYPCDAFKLLSRPYYNSDVCLGTYLTGQEVSIIAGLPLKEVPGITLREAVSFGLNEKNVDKEKDINLGKIVQKGRILENINFYVGRNVLKKHCFIAGTTGSGKTTTCHRLLKEAGKVPFLVIEPAKTEYRTLIKNEEACMDNLIVFTLGNESVAPFRINPFELIPGEVISSHVDMLKATFTSAFPMEASMPQLLEESIYECYKAKGWDINTNINNIYKEKAFDQDVDAFPILSELLTTMKKIVEDKGFSPQMKSDYIGSLVSRLSNLTVGSKGAMLNCAHSVDFKYIANHNVILEMEDLRSPEDKALLMGFVLSRLSAVIKDEHKKNPKYQHLTLIEEAHRLLAKVEPGEGGAKKVAVEMFADLLAEVRKYGEGLIIVDQIPNKLSPEVLKNTNTKIIHRILAKDDKEVVGDAMLMDDKQKQYLSALKVGEVVVYTENTDSPVNVKITQTINTNEEQVDNQVVIDRFYEYCNRFGRIYMDKDILLYYDKFADLSHEIGRWRINKKAIDEMTAIVGQLSKRHSITTEEVWSILVKRREVIDRWSAEADDEQQRSNRITELVDLFNRRMMRKDFSYKDIKRLNDMEIFF